MNISSQPRTSVVTIPWGPGAKVPPEQIEDELAVRDSIASFTHLATAHLATAEKSNNGWSRDKDPSPERVLHSMEANGVTTVAAVTTENPKSSPKKQIPSEWSLTTSDRSQSQHIVWENGSLVSLYVEREIHDGGVLDNTLTSSTMRVNDNGSLTWTLSVTDLKPT